MQYNPVFYWPPYCNNSSPYRPTAIGSQYTIPNPEIIGEGDVTSVMNADGSVQFFFLPRVIPSGPLRYQNCGAWFIRTITNPHVNQQYPGLYGTTFSHPQLPQIEALPATGYQVKFHNDGWTSTTDLHYFFPRLRQSEWIPKLGAAVQVELPTESANIYHYQVLCNKPCNCAQRCSKSRYNCDSNMSVDDENNSSASDSEKCIEKKDNVEKNSSGLSPNVNNKEKNKVKTEKPGAFVNECKECCASHSKGQKRFKIDQCSCSEEPNPPDPYECKHGRPKTVQPTIKIHGCECNVQTKYNKGSKNTVSEYNCKCNDAKSDKKTATFNDKSNSYTCDEKCGTSPKTSRIESKKNNKGSKAIPLQSDEKVIRICYSGVSSNFTNSTSSCRTDHSD